MERTGDDGCGATSRQRSARCSSQSIRCASRRWRGQRSRGEVLCALFFLLAVLAYRAHADARRPGARRGADGTSAPIGCFTLSLLSKATGITLPLVLLVLDIYPLRRLAHGSARQPAGDQLLIEKIPYVVLAAGAALLVLLAKQPEAMATLTEHGVAARIMQAFYGLCFYLWKTVVPTQLSPLYLLQKPLHPAAPRFVLSALWSSASRAA